MILRVHRATPFTDARSLMTARSRLDEMLKHTERVSINSRAISSPCMLLASVWARTKRCCTFQSLSMKRSTTTRISPRHVVPSKMTDTHFRSISCLSRICSSSRTKGIRLARWLLSVSLGPFLSRSCLKQDSLLRGMQSSKDAHSIHLLFNWQGFSL